jgi:hypothetical protein
MKPVRFISDVPALVYDPEHKQVIKVCRAVDRKGRIFESYNDGPYVPVESPEEPTKLNRKLGWTYRR